MEKGEMPNKILSDKPFPVVKPCYVHLTRNTLLEAAPSDCSQRYYVTPCYLHVQMTHSIVLDTSVNSHTNNKGTESISLHQSCIKKENNCEDSSLSSLTTGSEIVNLKESLESNNGQAVYEPESYNQCEFQSKPQGITGPSNVYPAGGISSEPGIDVHNDVSDMDYTPSDKNPNSGSEFIVKRKIIERAHVERRIEDSDHDGAAIQKRQNVVSRHATNINQKWEKTPNDTTLDKISPVIQGDAEKHFEKYVIWKYHMRCLICKKEFKRRSDFRQHILNEPHCVQFYRYSKNGTTHWRCPPCGYITPTRHTRKLLNHLVTTEKHGESGCVNVPKPNDESVEHTESSESMTKSRLSNDHSIEHVTNITTPNSSDKDGSPMYGDNSKKEDKSSLIKGGWFCKLCNVFIHKWYKEPAVTHIRNVHTNEFYKCKICSKKLHSEVTFQKHMKVHDEDHTGKVCTACGKSFKSKQSLERHEYGIHKITKSGSVNGKRFTCRICSKPFVNGVRRNRHEASHSAAKSLICDECGNAYKTMDGLLCHVKSKHNSDRQPRKKNYSKCDVCDKVVLKLQTHKMSHAEKTFSCDICGKKFTQKHHIKNHMVVHSGGRSFNCFICGFAFNLRHHLDSHLKTKHGFERVKKV